MLVEIRPSEGGEDATRFALDLLAAVVAYCRRKGWSTTVPDLHARTLSLQIEADAGKLEWLAGTHRIQRIPVSESRGRRHTSTATLAVLTYPHSDRHRSLCENDVDELFDRGSGSGGQHQNTSDTAVRLRHRPSGIEVYIQGRSQWQNRQDAWRELERRVHDQLDQEAAAARNDARRGQIASGERPAKSFTWNDQRDEVLCHTSGRRWRLRDAMKGRF